HLRRLAEQHLHRHVDDVVVELAVGNDELPFARERADNGERTALPLAQRPEPGKSIVGDDQDISFLRFIAPDTERRHPGLGVGDRTDIDAAPQLAVIDCLGYGIREAAGTYVVYQEYGVLIPESGAPVDNLLCPPLHLGISALNRCEIQLFGAAAAR